MDVRENLAMIIKERACIQAEIARRSELTPMMLSSALCKKRKLDANEFVRICEAISVSMDDVAKYRVSEKKEACVHENVSNSDT